MVRVRVLVAVTAVLALAYAVVYAAHRASEAARSLLACATTQSSCWMEVAREARALDLAGVRRLTVENQYGDVEIVGGGSEARLEVTKYAAGDHAAEARERGRKLRVTAAREGRSGFRITAGQRRAGRRAKANLLLRVPAGLALTVRQTAGDARVRGMAGPLEVHSRAGSVEVTSVRAGATVHFRAGEFVGDHVQGPVRVHGGVGSIRLRNVRSDAIAATLDCGEIVIAPHGPFSGKLTAYTRIGQVNIALRPGSRCRVSTSTHIGDVSDHLPARVLSRSGPGLIEASVSIGEVKLEEAS